MTHAPLLTWVTGTPVDVMVQTRKEWWSFILLWGDGPD